jgi:GH3 auxin-responsive promoter
MMGFTFPVLALQLADYLGQYGEDLVHDLAKGAIADWVVLEPALRARLERQLNAVPQRAKELQTLLHINGRLTPKDVFPNLSVIITARGGTSDFYFERFPTFFGDTPVFGGTYSSSETMFGVHRDLNTNGVILALESAFYEFLPEDQWDVAHPKTVLPWEVVPGQRYRILTTNYNGFYRYDIGDVVEVEGFYNQAPIFTFRHRLGGVISCTTEKTTEFHVIQVMQTLQPEFDIKLENFCITLSDAEIPPHYWVNIELAAGSSLSNPARFLQRFDERLQQLHQSYAMKRQDQVVPSPQLRILAPGSFATVQQRMVQRGATDFQLKFPHVTEDRTLLANLPILTEVRSRADRRPVLNH